jgi:hypothetical protein
MKSTRILITVLISTVLISWTLGVLRFDFEWAAILFNIILFPFGTLYALYESYCTHALSSSHFLNGEIFQGVMFGVFVICQAFLFIYVIWKLRLRWKKSSIITQ